MKIGGFEKSTIIDYPGKIACIVYTIGCNFRCPYCHNPELVDETAQEIDTEEVIGFLKNRKNILDAVVITGGEPTLHDDLPVFIKRLKDLGYLVKLDTNGTRPAMVKKLIEEKLVDYIAMDIKSPINKYSLTVGRPVYEEAIRCSIGMLINGKVDYEFRTTVVKSLLPMEDIEEIGEEIKGAKKYYLQRFNSDRILNPQFKKKVTYTEDEFKSFRQTLLNYVKHCEIR